ncbi:MAG: hypothetical protein LBC03_00790, partial [Nitrososphaerota archaeon]|nr:hypothetical protein [Nitrososphaerota archaeon]
HDKKTCKQILTTLYRPTDIKDYDIIRKHHNLSTDTETIRCTIRIEANRIRQLKIQKTPPNRDVIEV